MFDDTPQNPTTASTPLATPIAEDKPLTADEFDDMLSKQFKIPRNLLRGMTHTESGGNPDAVSSKAARGRYQVIPSTFEAMKKKWKRDDLSYDNPFDVDYVGARYLRELYDESPKDADERATWLRAVARYHGGGAKKDGTLSLASDGGITTAGHVEKVAKAWAEIENVSGDPYWDAEKRVYNWDKDKTSEVISLVDPAEQTDSEPVVETANPNLIVQDILKPKKVEESDFQRLTKKARQPKKGQVVKGTDPTRQDTKIGLNAEEVYKAKDILSNVKAQTANHFGIRPDEYDQLIQSGALDETAYDEAQLAQIKKSAQYYSLVAGDKKVYLPISEAQKNIITAYKRGGIEAAKLMRQEMDKLSGAYGGSLHEVAPEEVNEIESAQAAVARAASFGENTALEADLARGILQAIGAGDTEIAKELREFSKRIKSQIHDAEDVLDKSQLPLSLRAQQFLIKAASPATARMVASGGLGPAAIPALSAQAYLERPDLTHNERMKAAVEMGAVGLIPGAAGPAVGMLRNPLSRELVRAGLSGGVMIGQTAVNDPKADAWDLVGSFVMGAGFHLKAIGKSVIPGAMGMKLPTTTEMNRGVYLGDYEFKTRQKIADTLFEEIKPSDPSEAKGAKVNFDSVVNPKPTESLIVGSESPVGSQPKLKVIEIIEAKDPSGKPARDLDGEPVYTGIFINEQGQRVESLLSPLAAELYKNNLKRLGEIKNSTKEDIERLNPDPLVLGMQEAEQRVKASEHPAKSLEDLGKPVEPTNKSEIETKYQTEKDKFDKNLSKLQTQKEELKQQLAQFKKYADESDVITQMRKNLKDSATGQQVNMGANVLQQAVVTGYDLYRGLKEKGLGFAEWLKEMTGLVSPEAQPYLPDVWDKIQFLNESKTRGTVVRGEDGTWKFDGEPVKLFHATSAGFDEAGYKADARKWYEGKQALLEEKQRAHDMMLANSDPVNKAPWIDRLMASEERLANYEKDNPPPIEDTYRRGFDEFSTAKYGTSTDIGWYGIGIYFGDLAEAHKYSHGEGANIRPNYVRIENPLVWEYGKDSSIQRWLKGWKIDDGQVVSPSDRPDGWKLPKEIHDEAEAFVEGYLGDKTNKIQKLNTLNTRFHELLGQIKSLEKQLDTISTLEDLSNPNVAHKAELIREGIIQLKKERVDVQYAIQEASVPTWITDADLHQLSRGITTIMKDKGYDGVFVVEEKATGYKTEIADLKQSIANIEKDLQSKFIPPKQRQILKTTLAERKSRLDELTAMLDFRIKEFVAFSPDQIISTLDSWTPRNIKTGEEHSTQTAEQATNAITTKLAKGVSKFLADEGGYLDSERIKQLGRTIRNGILHNGNNLLANSSDAFAAFVKASATTPRVGLALTKFSYKADKILSTIGSSTKEYFSYLQQDRIEGLRDFATKQRDLATSLGDSDFILNFTKHADTDWYDYIKALNKVRPNDVVAPKQVVDALVASSFSGDYSVPRQMVRDSFQYMLDNLNQPFSGGQAAYLAYSQKPEIAEVNKIYKAEVGDLLETAHTLSGGDVSENLGPSGLYFPLIDKTHAEKIIQQSGGQPGSSAGLGKRELGEKPKAFASKIATGLSGEYTTQVESVRRVMTSIVRRGDVADFIQKMEDFGILIPGGVQKDPITGGWKRIDPPEPTGYDWIEAGPVRVFPHKTSIGSTPKETISTTYSPPQKGYWVKSEILGEIKPLIESGKKFSEVDVDNLVGRITGWAIWGLLEPTWHSWNVIKALQKTIPYIDINTRLGPAVNTLLTTAANVVNPFTLGLLKTGYAWKKVFDYKLFTEKDGKDLREMFELADKLVAEGGMPERAGKVTFSPKIAEMTGAELVGPKQWTAYGRLVTGDKTFGEKVKSTIDFGPVIYGWNGLDIRARLAAAHAIKKYAPDMPAAEVFDTLMAFGVYNRYLESKMGQVLKTYQIAPFYSAASAGILRGKRSLLNPYGNIGHMIANSVNAPEKAKMISAALAESGYMYTAMWAMSHHHLTNKWPWDDDDARFLELPVPESFRETIAGKILYPDPKKAAYFKMGINENLRGANSLGIQGAMNTWLAFGEPTKKVPRSSQVWTSFETGLFDAAIATPLRAGLTSSPMSHILPMAMFGQKIFPRTQANTTMGQGGLDYNFTYSAFSGQPINSERMSKQLLAGALEINAFMHNMADGVELSPTTHGIDNPAWASATRGIASLALGNLFSQPQKAIYNKVALRKSVMTAKKKPQRKSILSKEEDNEE